MKSNNTAPLNHNIIITEDGSITLKNIKINEACHSRSGAYSETFHNFIKSTNILNCEMDLNVFEMGFGLGYGAKVLFEKINTGKTINFFSLENDENIINWVIKNIEINSQFSPKFSELKKFKSQDIEYFHCKKNNINLYVVLGDAADSIKNIRKLTNIKFNFIFQDAFSPKNNPQFWDQNWFNHLNKISADNVLLATYTCSKGVLRSLVQANWFIESLEGFGQKKSITVANKINNNSPELYKNIIRSINPS